PLSLVETFQRSIKLWTPIQEGAEAMRIHTLRLTSGLAVLLSLLSSDALAQFSQRGGISGVVTDASGAVVPKASVTLLAPGRNQTSTISTDGSGHYEFSQLLSGTYQVSVELAGFK